MIGVGGLRSDAARNRERILATARAVVARGDALALNALAKAAGVGVATVYRHFATVDELEESLAWERFDHLAAVLRDSSGVEPALTALFGLMVEDELFQKVNARTPSALPRTAELRRALTDQLQQVMHRARGDLRPDVDADGAVLLVCGVASAVRSAGLSAGDAQARVLLRVVLDGLRRGG